MRLKKRSVACKLLHVKYNRCFFCLVLLLKHKLLIGGSSAKQSSKTQLANQKSAVAHGNTVLVFCASPSNFICCVSCSPLIVEAHFVVPDGKILLTPTTSSSSHCQVSLLSNRTYLLPKLLSCALTLTRGISNLLIPERSCPSRY